MKQFIYECIMAVCVAGLVAVWLISEGVITR